MAGSGWYYVDNETRVGPVERAELERLISQGVVGAQTMIWREGMDGWEEAAAHFDIASSTSGPPPIVPPRPAASASYGVTGVTAVPGQASSSDGLYSGAPARGFTEAISVCFSKYVGFSGRASRSEYWYFVLFNLIVGFVTGFIDGLVFGLETELSPFNTIASLILFLPATAAGWRRLHDTNRSGWWIGAFWLAALAIGILVAAMGLSNPYIFDDMIVLISLIGLAGIVYGIVLLVFLCQKGDPGPNRFG